MGYRREDSIDVASGMRLRREQREREKQNQPEEDPLSMESINKDLQRKASDWRSVASELAQLREEVNRLGVGNTRSKTHKIFMQLKKAQELANEEADEIKGMIR